MSPSRAKLPLLLLSLSILLLQGCALNTEMTSAKAVAEGIGHVHASRSDTCRTQEQIAEQSSKIDTIITGRETVYKPDCPKKIVPKATS